MSEEVDYVQFFYLQSAYKNFSNITSKTLLYYAKVLAYIYLLQFGLVDFILRWDEPIVLLFSLHAQKLYF